MNESPSVQPSASARMCEARAARTRNRIVALMAVLILVPSMLGFVNKFIELIHVFQGDAAGAFAIAPIMNYILASTGFLLMLGWAAANGMFHDIEGPKLKMLQIERALDAREQEL